MMKIKVKFFFFSCTQIGNNSEKFQFQKKKKSPPWIRLQTGLTIINPSYWYDKDEFRENFIVIKINTY
jgi:hypothetical protein